MDDQCNVNSLVVRQLLYKQQVLMLRLALVMKQYTNQYQNFL